MLSPMPHSHREDVLEVSILDTINVPRRKDGSARQPFFSALIPSTEQRWQQQNSSSSSTSSSSIPNQTFFFSVADRQERSVKIALWDRKENGTDSEHQKLLGECTIPLYYVGWQWVDAKLKLKAADGAQPSKYAASYLRTRMRFTRDSRSGGKSGDIQPVEELEPSRKGSEEASTKATPERKKFWRHTRDLGKRSPLIDRNPRQNEFLMSQDIRTVGGSEYADNMDKQPSHSARTEMLLSQPVRTISINADDSSSSDSSSGSGASSDESDDARPPAKQGSGLSRRLSRDITKLRQLLTLTDSHQAQPLTNTRSLSPKGSSQGGRKFWTIGRQSEASLEVTKSAEELQPVRDSVTSIDWHNGAQARTLSDGDMASLEPMKGSSKRTKKNKKAVKKKKKTKKDEGEEQQPHEESAGGKDRSLSGSSIIKKLKKKTTKTTKSQNHQKVEDKEEEGWERDSSGEQRTHSLKHKRETSRDDESGVVLAVIDEHEGENKEESVKDSEASSSEFEAVASATTSTATTSSSGELSPTPSGEIKRDDDEEVEAEVVKLAKKKTKKRKEDKRKSKSSTLPVAAADKSLKSKSKKTKAKETPTPTKA